MKLTVGDEIWASNEYTGPYLVEVLEIHDDIGEYCDLTGPGFIGSIILDECNCNVADEALELCFTLDQIDVTGDRAPVSP